MKKIHPVQQLLLDLANKENLSAMSLRQIGDRINVSNSPQLIKHHLGQLQKKGLIKLDWSFNVFSSVSKQIANSVAFKRIPVLGSANCGLPTLIAEERVDGFLQVSSSVLRKNTNHIFAVKAEGNSMNKADIYGNDIDSGDYVLIDPDDLNVRNGDYVLSIIDGCANIKQIKINRTQEQIILLSQSTENHPPIVIGSDQNFLINGKVVQVIKTSMQA